jgi:hypothetical protein
VTRGRDGDFTAQVCFSNTTKQYYVNIDVNNMLCGTNCSSRNIKITKAMIFNKNTECLKPCLQNKDKNKNKLPEVI